MALMTENQSMKISEGYSFDDVLLVPQYSEIHSRSTCNVTPTLPKLQLNIPVFAANMDTICGISMVKKMDSLGGCGVLHRYLPASSTHNLIQEWEEDSPMLVVSVGTLERDKARIISVVKSGKKNIGICVDIAHGNSKNMIDTLEYIKENKDFGGPVIAGNVCTYDGARRLFDAGADIVKVGVGPGSTCTTRIKTGIGIPQLAAIQLCAPAGPIIADGGIRTPGDAAKAIAMGANAVMVGGMLAGTDHVPLYGNPEPMMQFRGMASKEAREECGQASNHTEGVSKLVSKQGKGSTEKVIIDIVEGIMSSMSYSGATTIEDFQEKALFVKVTPSSVKENGAHHGS
jgi:IMP dehydrogenase